MKIEFNFGPHAGQTEHVPQNPLTDLLVKSGVLKLVEEFPHRNIHVAHPNGAPLWSAGFGATGDPMISLKAGFRGQAQPYGTELFYIGKPEDAADYFKRSGFDLPESVRRDYQSLYNRPDPEALAERQRLAQQSGQR